MAQRIAGIVILRNVVNADAPSVAAASSCSIPTSRSTGTTSRTTNGSETNSIARSIAGYAKSIWIPCAVSQPPNHPSRAYNRYSARPTTTGESASGRSTIALTSPLPGIR